MRGELAEVAGESVRGDVVVLVVGVVAVVAYTCETFVFLLGC